MSFAKRLLLFGLALTLAVVVVVCLTPLLVSNGIRLFLLAKGHAQGVKIAFAEIKAPFFRPVEIRQLRVTSTRPCAFQVELAAASVELDLNLRALLTRSSARVIHAVAIEGLHGEVRRVPQETAACNFDWRFLHQLLADDARLSDLDFRVNNGSTQIELHGVDVNVSEIEAGKFNAREIRIAAPWLQQRFSNLRGATAWANDRLTIGALSLARGLDLETITADFSRLEKKRTGLELNLDAFGGKLRASVATENREKGVIWNVAGTASEISLSQLSTTLRLREWAGGSVHASKFTFRGDPQNLAQATALIWTEVTGFTWRDRTAETVMLGASLYNRQVDVEQLYVKQRNNQFTLSGEYALPAKSSDWINPNFRADISASVNDLGDFARLFGASENKFSGSLAIAGTVNSRNRNLGGEIKLGGQSLRLFATPLDTLDARLTLKGSKLRIDSLQARRGNDVLEVKAEADLAHEHRYSAKINASLGSIADYVALLPAAWQSRQPDGRVSIEWNPHGTWNSHSGDFRLQMQNVRLNTRFGLQAFDARFDATYSPQNIFFREFQFSNAHASLSAFVTVSANYLQLQTLRFDLNGKAKLQGNIFIPVALNQWLRRNTLLEGLDEAQNFDVELVLDSIDLPELQAALTDRTDISGNLSARLESYGQFRSLQSTWDVHLRDFAFQDPARISADLRAEIVSGSLNLNATATAAGSHPVKLAAKVPLPNSQQGKEPFSFTLDFPAIFLSKLPRYLTREVFRDGILSGRLAGSGTLRNPNFNGDVQLVNGRFVKSPGPVDGIDGHLVFHGSSATLAFANIDLSDGRLPFHGALDFTDIWKASLKLIPDVPVSEFSTVAQNKCVSGANFFAMNRTDPERHDTSIFAEVREIDLHEGIASGPWTITLIEYGRAEPLNSKSLFSRSFRLCKSNEEVLHFGIQAMPRIQFGQTALKTFEGRDQPASTLNPRQP